MTAQQMLQNYKMYQTGSATLPSSSVVLPSSFVHPMSKGMVDAHYIPIEVPMETVTPDYSDYDSDYEEDLIFGFDPDTFRKVPIGSRTLQDNITKYRSEPNNEVKRYSFSDLEVGDIVLSLYGNEYTIKTINSVWIESTSGMLWNKDGKESNHPKFHAYDNIMYTVKKIYKDETKGIDGLLQRAKLIQNMNKQWDKISERREAEVPFSFDKLEIGDDIILTNGQKAFVLDIKKPWFGVKTIIGRPYSSTYDEWHWSERGKGKIQLGSYFIPWGIKTIIKQNKPKQIPLIDEEAVTAFLDGKTTFNKWLNATR